MLHVISISIRDLLKNIKNRAKTASEFSQKSLHFLKLAYSDAVLALFLIFLMKTFKPLTPPPTKFPLYCKITRARVRQQKNISDPPFYSDPPVYYILQKIRTPPFIRTPPTIRDLRVPTLNKE